MANSNAPTGLRPIADNGTPWSGQGRMICFPAAYATAVYLGDPLVATGAADGNGVPVCNVASAGAGNSVLGSFIGLTNGPAGGGASAITAVTRDLNVWRAASVLAYGLICDDPNQLYMVQEDSNGGAIAAATSTFANGNLVSGSGNNVTGFSGWQLQSSSVTSSANTTFQLKLLGLVRGPDNAIGANAKWVVRLNNPQLWSTTGV